MFWQQHNLYALEGHYACSLLHVDLQSGLGRHVSNDAARLVRILSIQHNMHTVPDSLYSISVNVTVNSDTVHRLSCWVHCVVVSIEAVRHTFFSDCALVMALSG